jgi:alkylation response protein AidB-like acyl-CoA dehydrogenase
MAALAKQGDGKAMSSELANAVREICDTISKKVDRAYVFACGRKRERPEKLWDLWAESGLLGIGVDEKYGGLGGGITEVVLAHDLLYQHGLVMPETITSHMVRHSLLHFGSEEQKQRYIPPTVTGKEFFAFAVTEADAGTNTFNIKTNAKKNADGDYIVNGEKIYITAFAEADHALLVARTGQPDKQKRTAGLSLFIVDPKAAGISTTVMDIGHYVPDKNYIVHFDDVVVPAGNLVGNEGEGLQAMFACLNSERVLSSGMAVGLADHALARGVEYAKTRAPFGTPIGAYQSIQHPMAMAKAQIEAARALLYKACEKLEAGDNAGLEANMSKLLTAEAFKAAIDITTTAFGGASMDLTQDLIPFYLLAKLQEVAPVNNNIVKSFIAQQALGLPRSS